MKQLRRICVYLVLLAMLGTGTALACWNLGTECLSVLRTGRGETEYFLTASDAEGAVYALGRRDGVYHIVKGDQTGRRTEQWELTAEGIPAESRPTALYAASGGAVYLGLYDTTEPTVRLRLFRITDQGQAAELLLSESCRGTSIPEQMASLRLSAFSEVESVVTFAVLEGNTAQFYRRTGSINGLERGERLEQEGLVTALALSDGTLLAATSDTLYRADREARTLDGAVLIRLIRAGTGVYCVDGASLEVFYADFADWQPYSILQLEKDAYALDGCTDLWVTRDGGALLLMDGGELLLDRSGVVTDLSNMLVRPAWQCVLILAGLALAVIAVSTAIWYIVCEQRRLRLPMLVRWGLMTAMLAALVLGGMIRWWLVPAGEAAGQQTALEMIDGVVTLAVEEGSEWNEELTQRIGNSLASAGDGIYLDTAVSVYERDSQGRWYLRATNTGEPVGMRAETTLAFQADQAELARDQWKAAKVLTYGEGSRLLCCWSQGRTLLAASVDGSGVLARSGESVRWAATAMTALAALLTALLLFSLGQITIGVRRVSRGMARLASGQRGVAVRVSTGDEVAGLADSLTALSRTMENVELHQGQLAQSYRRFVPERVLSLLGKTSIQEVDKHTVVSRNMATMMIAFKFPEQVYEKSGRELFDHVNEILERTAPIVTRNGGAVFNFAYDGYDAVFEGGSAAAVSTAVAVQQEVLEINRRRETAGEPPVTLRIALDEGSVMIGVVGDENQIEPTSISSSFSTVKHLLELCGALEANILCTEAVVAAAKGYGSRYMGKCREGGELIRAYEIFDGDPYEVRKLKEQTGKQFSEGVYALYSQDFSTAKRVFLNLVHQNAGDGGARYYLYLADRLEKRPEEAISLDPER